ncbi:MAG: hypothetical protein ACRENJ_00525 [Candidatus Eiseniibacteriota bacterium]
MTRKLAPALLALSLVSACAGPTKLAERSESRLAGGDHWQAWTLATRALDKAPANQRARLAAAAAAASISQDWQRRVRALAGADSLAAAEQVLEFSEFRAGAARYTTVAVDATWAEEERTLRLAAARTHFKRGTTAMAANRPRRAWLSFTDAERFVPGYRDVAVRAERAYEKAIARIAFVPFSTAPGHASLGREVAAEWRDALARRLRPPEARFTRILGSQAVEHAMSVSQLGRTSRQEALRLGREAGADRIVWGSIGGVNAETRLHLFKDTVARRVVEKGSDGHETVRWVELPIEVVARVRTVTVAVEHELIAARGGATVARQRAERSTSARVVWTSFAPEGDLAAYHLVREDVRTGDPSRVKDVESRWHSTCGEKTTLRQVLEARRATRSGARYDRNALSRFIGGAAFVFLEDLPPPEDLAYAALAEGWQPLLDDLLRLDAIDDVDLGVAMREAGGD